ncbi:hypothetical protein V8C43DRAFT_275660 [Trichoderma afarasin]
MLAQQSADQCGWGTGQVSAPYRRGWALGLVLWRGANANALLVQNIDSIDPFDPMLSMRGSFWHRHRIPIS